MDISTLQLFVEVMRQGSFAAVARDCNLDPSSVSQVIAGLEEELGIRLEIGLFASRGDYDCKPQHVSIKN